MSTNKNAIIRYQALDKCFRNPGRKYFIEDLIEACSNALYEFDGTDTGIQVRQLYDDLIFMESPQGWEIPLERIKDGRKTYYRYSDMSFSINNQPLNESEKMQLKETLLTLSRFKGMPQFEWVQEIIARLDSGLGLSKSEDKIIEFEQNFFLKGLEFINPCYYAILYKKTLNILYKGFEMEVARSFCIHPYYLKEYNNRWYLFGVNDEDGMLLNMPLDRFVDITDCKTEYVPKTSIDFDEYFEDIIGVTLYKDKPVETITLKIENELYNYISTKPIHGSQKLKEKGQTHTWITLKLIPNYELESWILFYGQKLEVVSPEFLREKIKTRVMQMADQYRS